MSALDAMSFMITTFEINGAGNGPNYKQEGKTMYKSFDEAKEAALKVIAKFGGDKMGCVVSETMTRTGPIFGFRFYSEDSHGEYVDINGELCKLTII